MASAPAAIARLGDETINNIISTQHIKRVRMIREAGIITCGISRHPPVFAAQTTGEQLLGKVDW